MFKSIVLSVCLLTTLVIAEDGETVPDGDFKSRASRKYREIKELAKDLPCFNNQEFDARFKRLCEDQEKNDVESFLDQTHARLVAWRQISQETERVEKIHKDKEDHLRSEIVKKQESSRDSGEVTALRESYFNLYRRYEANRFRPAVLEIVGDRDAEMARSLANKILCAIEKGVPVGWFFARVGCRDISKPTPNPFKLRQLLFEMPEFEEPRDAVYSAVTAPLEKPWPQERVLSFYRLIEACIWFDELENALCSDGEALRSRLIAVWKRFKDWSFDYRLPTSDEFNQVAEMAKRIWDEKKAEQLPELECLVLKVEAGCPKGVGRFVYNRDF